MTVEVALDVEPQVLGELLARRLRQASPDLSVTVGGQAERQDAVTVTVCTTARAAGPAGDADVMVLLHDEAATAGTRPLATLHDRTRRLSGGADPVIVADLADLVDHIRALVDD